MGGNWVSDLGAAWKGVRAGRWTSVSAVTALALGTGACLAAAVIAWAGMLRPLPLTAPDRLVTPRRIFITSGFEMGIRLNEFDRWQQLLAPAMDAAGYATERATFREAGAEARDVRAAYITDTWFTVLGAHTELGRLPDASALDSAVVSRAFAAKISAGALASVIGRAFTLGGHNWQIIGVLPESFSVVDKADVWMAARSATALSPTSVGDVRSYLLVARVKSGVSMTDAQSVTARAVVDAVPDNQKANYRPLLKPLREVLLGDARPVVLALFIATVLVLLVACANVAMLLVNRAVARAREFSVRLALGADRARLVRVAVFETALIAAVGAAIGIGLAAAALQLLAAQTGLDLPRVTTFTTATPLVVAALAMTLLVVIVCGAAPVLTLRQMQLTASLRASASAGSRASRRLRAALVVAQLAMAVVLLTGAGLLARTVAVLARTDIGLDRTDQVVTMAVPIGESTLPPEGRLAMTEQLLQDVRRIPGVAAAGVGAALPPSVGGLMFTIRVSSEKTDATRTFDLVPVTPGYFESIGARLVSGRFFNESDSADDPVTILSETAVKHLALVTRTTLDTTLNMALPTAKGPRVKPRIIGVIKDVRYSGLDTQAHGGVYVLWRQLPLGRAFLTVRTSGDPAALTSDVTRTVRTADPSLPLEGAKTLSRVIEATLAPRTARVSIVGVLAGGAVLLALVGLAIALVRSVVERQRELAIRAAIGATPRELLSAVLKQGAALAVTGVALGLAASAGLARAAVTMFYGVTPYDPMTYAATAAGVLVVAVFACYVPARRAAAADPIVLLRSE